MKMPQEDVNCQLPSLQVKGESGCKNINHEWYSDFPGIIHAKVVQTYMLNNMLIEAPARCHDMTAQPTPCL
jgi:hypothetical protein